MLLRIAKLDMDLKNSLRQLLFKFFKCYCLKKKKKKITKNLSWLVLPGEICFVSFYFLAN